MTKLLERAISEVSAMADADQDAIAQLVLDEIASERKWDELFARSHDVLERMAAEAIAEHEAGLTTELVPEEL